jgi:hypothetical protein
MGSLTIALIVGGWGIAALLVLRLFATASRSDDDDEQAPAEPTVAAEGVRSRRFKPQPEGTPTDVAAAGRKRG